MDGADTRWCSAPGCMLNIKIMKRHFFRFPKDRKRWLEWIKACNRMDLMTTGPEYANRYYRLCHLHFRVEMLRNIEGRIYLSKEAVPSIFLKPLLTGNSTSTTLFQPISFVTIFLKPESRHKNSSSDLSQSEVSQTHPMKPEEKDTAIISPVQALFPKASMKLAYDDRNVSSAQTTLLDVKSNDNRSASTTEIQFVKEMYVDTKAASSTSSQIFSVEGCSDTDIIDLTTMDSLEPTKSSKAVSVCATQQNGDRAPKRRRWNVSTQTPEAWIYIDSFLRGKKRTETSETCDLVAKRRKTFGAEDEDCRVNIDQFKAACTDLLPHSSALLVSACINACEKPKAMKSFEDRQFALELFFMASDAYRFYRPFLSLPTVRQLWRHIRNWDMPPGLNDNVLNALRLKIKSLSPAERHCSLCVNEMQLRPHLFYNLSRDRIVGFHDTGTDKRRTLSRKVLVIVACSLVGDWEQPVAYYFHGTCRVDTLKTLIFQAITRLKSIGANVHALTTNTSPTFLRLSQLLGITAERPSFLVNDERVFYIFDVTRLMRVTRNVFRSHELRFCEKRASWTDIELFFRRDSQMRLPLAPKLSVSHLEPDKCQKLETKYAVQVFSGSIAAGLSAHIASGELPLETIGTMEFIHNFDRLFDVLNSSASAKSSAKDFGQAFTGSVHEMSFLQQTLDFFKSLKIVDRNGACVKSIKCFDRWQITINAIIQLWDVLKGHQLPFLCTRRLNQESIERIFRSIRRQSGDRARPTPILFTRAFKNLVSKHFLEHSSGGDSAANGRKMLKRITSTPSLSVVSPTDEVPPDVQAALGVAATNYRNIDLPERCAFKRVCEFLLNECLQAHVNCDVCVAYAAKEGGCSSSRDTANSFNRYIRGLEDMFMRNFEKLSTEEKLGAQMLQLAQQVEYKPPCPDFPVALLVKLFLRMRIYFTLLRHNKICKGTEPRSSLNVMQL
ncbi:PREDICTED: uncharacterized protein LOC105559356 [Vollenhovia emeryi]|uniref:uncharacterized protein LOC105559356 n=1 Tax=Vollenhovia emeryi TaxID=411798 RepID=UPI0005F386AF|nr:PREDICTED: uncharacterized protein LOC105559356 [Vollenhovia emeryi]XP_011862966.1 PREDICTED: uncharacterized protein LOC105559356 [Vollenhovia emeryi]XP_011862967.1 PREDICTED: uncharacterized protein LOC105559356 [Vollenhovia emeryi]XP_011862968.1 PREDICTED: uncharacterized protein LOC105559356 [Vollenhovia emeryi]